MKRYFIISWSAFILEIASTMYISNVSEKSVGMLFWAFISPFLGLPFVGYMVETKTWVERIKMAFALSIGYLFGAILVYFYN